MRNHLIAIQGAIASFHDLAARKYFGEEISVLECGSFKEVCDKIKNNVVDYGIIAIENKVAGSILLNYQLIESYGLHIIGETYLPIELKLLGKKGTDTKMLKEIISHPMALGQSQDFLSRQEGVTITEYKDTATCAKMVADDVSGNLAVIAGPTLARMYDLEVLEENVGDVKSNYTRFYIISKGKDFVDDPNKASVIVRTKNVAGQLSEVLNIIKDAGINLSKIQSVPVPEDQHSYSFHLDMEFESKDLLESTIKTLNEMTGHARILGIYKKEAFKISSLPTNEILNNMN